MYVLTWNDYDGVKDAVASEDKKMLTSLKRKLDNSDYETTLTKVNVIDTPLSVYYEASIEIYRDMQDEPYDKWYINSTEVQVGDTMPEAKVEDNGYYITVTGYGKTEAQADKACLKEANAKRLIINAEIKAEEAAEAAEEAARYAALPKCDCCGKVL
jgi:hypothetical protein